MYNPPLNVSPEMVRKQVREFVRSDDWTISILANVAALLNDYLADLNWVGFYLWRNGKLHLGPFQGKVACTQIGYGKGVCGTSYALEKSLLVPNVHDFPGHIACDSASNSELVIPFYIQNRLVGVLDLDSPLLRRFTIDDQRFLESLVRELNSLSPL